MVSQRTPRADSKAMLATSHCRTARLAASRRRARQAAVSAAAFAGGVMAALAWLGAVL